MNLRKKFNNKVSGQKAESFFSSSHSLYFDDNKPQEALGKQSLRSGVVNAFSRGINIIVQIGSTICLARLLMPEDFGLVAMVVAITGFASVLMDLGTRDAAVQKSRVTPDEISALFWLTVGIGGCLTVATFLSSSLISEFYQDKRLEIIAQVWGILFILNALSCQHTALLRRALMFQKIAIIDVVANLLGAGLAIATALMGGGYWALVVRPIVVSFFTMMGIWLSCRWLPGVPKFSHGVKEMLKFGLQITGFTMTDYVGNAADRVALGYTTGATELGYYQNASVVYENPLSIFGVPLHSVAVASLSKLRNSLDELRRYWYTALSSLAFFAMPMFIILAVTGPDVVVVLLGDKWFHAGTILSIVALRGPAHVIERTLGWLHVAAGRADRWMRWGIVSSLIQLFALLCGLPFGTLGVATAYTVCMYILFVPAVVYSGHPFELKVSHVIKAIGPQLLGALIAAAIGFLLREVYLSDVSVLVRVPSLVFACGVSYLLVTVGMFRLVKPLEVAGSLMLDLLPACFSPLFHVGFMRRWRKT